ncbi:MAG: beta-N-acetylhexosaminidase [Proteobacteria bacterium]|nr:MAG: beta-N-acetylhexosaminidase [Pseudomonadota bacterium]
MLDLEGPRLTEDEKKLLARPEVGGVIFFTRNYESVSQLSALIESIRQINPAILIAVDHEGGRVQRFRSGFTTLPPVSVLGELYQANADIACKASEKLGWLMAAELRSAGIDFSFAPVLDLDWSRSGVIGNRAFSDNPEVVFQLSRHYLDGMHRAGMAATGKHFPGHGYVEADSHTEIPVDSRGYDELADRDILPFERLIKSGLDAIMPAHVIYSEVDQSPAGFSSCWLQKILRGQLGFTGVIFSDDLTMEGAAVAGSFQARAESAFKAGCDMVLVCNHRSGALDVLDWMKDQGMTGLSKLSTMQGRNHYSGFSDLIQSGLWKETVATLKQWLR